MRTRIVATLAALLLLLAACGEDNGTDEATEGLDGDLGVETDEQLPEVDLDDGIAASVNGTEIATAEVDERVDSAVAADPELSGQLEGEEGDQLLEMFRAQTLTILVQTQIILDGAADMGVEPDEADIAEAREQLVAELGGEEAFDEAVASAGISEAALADQLEGIAALNAVGDILVEEGAADDLPEQPEGAPDADPSDLAVQQWLGERVATAEVAVHPDFGLWDPQTGQVMPAGMGQPVPGIPGDE